MKNPTDILIDATKFPAAIEAKLPAGAPKLSTMLTDIANKLPKVPDLPIDIPAPPVPELPELPALPGGAELKRYVSKVEVRPVGAPAPTPAGGRSWAVTPIEAAGVVGQGHTVRDYA